MMKRTLTIALILILAGLVQAGTAWAFQSPIKNDDTSLTRPATVNLPSLAAFTVRDITAEVTRRHVEITVIVRNIKKTVAATAVR